MVILLYVVVRVDRRFWVPNGARAAGDYAAGGSGKEVELEKGVERGIMPEEEVFDDVPEAEVVDAVDGKKKSADPEKQIPEPEKQTSEPEKQNPAPDNKIPELEEKVSEPEKQILESENKIPEPEKPTSDPEKEATSAPDSKPAAAEEKI